MRTDRLVAAGRPGFGLSRFGAGLASLFAIGVLILNKLIIHDGGSNGPFVLVIGFVVAAGLVRLLHSIAVRREAHKRSPNDP